MDTEIPSDPSPEEITILSQIPVIPPPAGVESNLINPQGCGLPVIVVGSLLMGLAAVFFADRIYMKAWIVRKFAWDDCELGAPAWFRSSHSDLCTVTLAVGFVSLTQRARLVAELLTSFLLG